MNKLWAALLSIIPTLFVSAQTQSYEGTVEYLKKDQKAMVIEFPYAPSVVEEAIVKKMETMGYKKKESKGFLIYKNAVISDISAEAADYAIKVDRKSRKDKDESVVYFVMNKGEENVVARNDAFLNSNVKTFLNHLQPHVESHHLELRVKEQEETVTKSEKKLKKLIDEKEEMEKKIKKLQEDLEENAKDQETQAKDIESQKQILETLKAKRK